MTLFPHIWCLNVKSKVSGHASERAPTLPEIQICWRLDSLLTWSSDPNCSLKFLLKDLQTTSLLRELSDVLTIMLLFLFSFNQKQLQVLSAQILRSFFCEGLHVQKAAVRKWKRAKLHANVFMKDNLRDKTCFFILKGTSQSLNSDIKDIWRSKCKITHLDGTWFMFIKVLKSMHLQSADQRLEQKLEGKISDKTLLEFNVQKVRNVCFLRKTFVSAA